MGGGVDVEDVPDDAEGECGEADCAEAVLTDEGVEECEDEIKLGDEGHEPEDGRELGRFFEDGIEIVVPEDEMAEDVLEGEVGAVEEYGKEHGAEQHAEVGGVEAKDAFFHEGEDGDAFGFAGSNAEVDAKATEDDEDAHAYPAVVAGKRGDVNQELAHAFDGLVEDVGEDGQPKRNARM